MKELRLVALGDSLTYGYGVLSHVSFPARLAEELPKKLGDIHWKIYNQGINGETTREARLRLKSSVLRLKPHICTILLGSNDSALNEGQYRTPWEYEKNLRCIISELLAEKHGDALGGGFCLPILITPPPVVDTDFYPFTTTDRLAFFADIVRKLATEYHLPLVDVFQTFTDIQKNQGFAAYESLFQFDGVHWSNHGYDVFYPLLEKTLLTLIKER